MTLCYIIVLDPDTKLNKLKQESTKVKSQNMSCYSTTEDVFICVAAIPIMLKAFEEGVRFVLTNSLIIEGRVAMIDNKGIKYTARLYRVNQEIHCIVTNDERRRLLPLLKSLRNI